MYVFISICIYTVCVYTCICSYICIYSYTVCIYVGFNVQSLLCTHLNVSIDSMGALYIRRYRWLPQEAEQRHFLCTFVISCCASGGRASWSLSQSQNPRHLSTVVSAPLFARLRAAQNDFFLSFFLLIKESFQLMALARCCGSTLCFLLSRICRLGFAPSIFRRQLFPSAQVPPGFLLSSAQREVGGNGGDNKGKQMNKGREKRKIYIKHNCCHFTFYQVWWLAEPERLSYFPLFLLSYFPFLPSLLSESRR